MLKWAQRVKQPWSSQSYLLTPQRHQHYAQLTINSTKHSHALKKFTMAWVSTAAAVGIMGTALYHTNDSSRHIIQSVQRCSIAGIASAKVGLDYKKTLSRSYATKEEREKAKRACHQRSADCILQSLQRLGGIYIKLGQHVSALVYILPIEWTSTMSVLQDRCDPTPSQDIRDLFLSDYGQPLEDVFEVFDWNPIGVASLAQVHRAKLKDTDNHDGWVAVKFQHPTLDEFSIVDTDTVTFLFGVIKRFFPEFGFEWLAQEMQETLPKELDFVYEANNACKVQANFEQEHKQRNTSLKIPNVIWAKRRIMCMEYIDGVRIDDHEFMKRHGIDPRQVSNEMARVFSKMIFIDGFVHCDPHPGNILIRPAKDPRSSKYNFDFVLLDHGLYKSISNELRLDYAHLWRAIITGDEEGIKEYSFKVGGTDIYHLFACMLTGRDWETIGSTNLSSVRTDAEFQRLSNGAMDYLVQVADILGRMPRPVLLLLKTNDLLRVVDETLNVVAQQKSTYIIMGAFCSKAVWIDVKERLMSQLAIKYHWHSFIELAKAWWLFQSIIWSLWLYEEGTSLMRRISSLGQKNTSLP